MCIVVRLLLRVFFSITGLTADFGDLFTLTFVCVVPIVIGIIPLGFAKNEELSLKSFFLARPVASVLLFFLFCFVTRLEDAICMLIMALPFMMLAGISGIIYSNFIEKKRRRKGSCIRF